MSRCFFVNKFPKISFTRHFIHMALTILPFYATIEAKTSKMCPFSKLKASNIFLEEHKKC